jgi:hypothetical protein
MVPVACSSTPQHGRNGCCSLRHIPALAPLFSGEDRTVVGQYLRRHTSAAERGEDDLITSSPKDVEDTSGMSGDGQLPPIPCVLIAPACAMSRKGSTS